MNKTKSAPRATPVSPRHHDDDDPRALHATVAATAAFFWLIAAAAIMRVTHAQGWIVLAVHIILAVALAASGFWRKPRPLSLRSVVYRFLAVFVAGQWLFWNVADLGRGGQEVLAMVCQLLLVAVVGGIVFFGGRAGFWQIAAVIAVLVLVAGEVAIFTLTGAFGGGAGQWIAHAMTVTEPLTKDNFFTWLWPGALVSAGTLCTAGGMLGLVFANHEHDEDEKKTMALALRSVTRAQAAMTELLQEFANDKRLMCIDVKKWANSAGETYEINTAAAGMSWRDLARFCDQLADRMMLPDGCGVEAAKGTRRGLALLHVNRVNRLSENHNYPMHEIKPRNIYEGLPVGVLRPGDYVTITVRENGVIIIGQKRSGKTLWLDVFMADLGQCVDTLIWVIDFNGGGAALPYLYAWAEGRADRPMIDWVADDEEEALKMARTALEIAIDRKQSYKFRKKNAGVTLLPIDKDVPQIIIVLDEGAEAMGTSTNPVAAEVCELLEKLQRVAGDSGVNVIWSFLRATSDAVNPAVKKQSPIRVAMRVSDEEELAYLFQWKNRLNPDDAPDQGMGFIQSAHAEPIRVFKGFFLDPAMMDEIAVKTAGWRPYLDLRGRQVGGKVYRDRWVRMQHLLYLEDGTLREDINLNVDAGAPTAHAPGLAGEGQAATVAAKAGTADTAAGGGGTATAVLDQSDIERLQRRRTVAGMDSDDIAARTDDVLDNLRRAGGQGPVDPDSAFNDIVAREFADVPPWSDEPPSVSGPPPSTGGGGDGEIVVPPAGPDGKHTAEQRIAVLEQLVKRYGPIGRTDLHKRLVQLGVDATVVTMDADLSKVPWLAPREARQPYDHKDRQA